MRRTWLVILGIGLLLTVRDVSLLPDGKTHVAFFDVGQGDAALVTTGSGMRVLIDGGADWTALSAIGEALPFFDRRIDAIVLSHPNADHMTSLPEVLRRYRVRTLFIAGTVFDSGLYRRTLMEAERAGVKTTVLHAGDTVTLEGGSISVLWPPKTRPPGMSKNENNDSLTVALEAGGKRVLFTGDLESIVERTLVAAHADLKADILKVPHHGSKSSSSTGFLLAVSPSLAVISVGRENSYGHPSAEVLRRYETLEIPLRRTDIEGTVEVEW